ncbi:MAG TPA: M1 family aminopeptidase [Pyrinomonadaceae bacterium]|nr:M1 family aminopeptidase [Pyrinomonadaceae bacterium]
MLNKSFLLRLKASLLPLVIIFSLVAGVSATPARHRVSAQQTPRPTRPFPPTQYIPERDFDTRHIALDLKFDWDKEQLIGRETLVFAPLTPNLRTVKLDATNITATAAKLSSGAALQFVNDAENNKLVITLDRGYQPADELTINIDYHTNGPQKKGLTGLVGVGLNFIKPNPDDPTRPKQIWSQGESEYNHYWFPCFDHPNDFFTSEITATVEKPLSVISNGKLIETKENKDGTRTFHWKIDQPHASYLTSIVVGEYTAVVGDYAGIPVISNVYPSEEKEARVTVSRLPEMVKFFSEKTGLKYPYAKYAQTMARDFGGGMENISATTQTDNMIHDARGELDGTSDGLESHELAHQWFGDYVTCRNWSDIWLNESFATYFQAMWDEHKLGGDDFLYSDIKQNQDAYFNAWRQGNRRPIVTKNYTDPDAVFDTYAYPRGGAVLHMLRRNLGDDNWWRAINHYLTKYANQPVQTEQFRIAIEEATGQSMDWFFDEWLYRMGHPVFKVTQEFDEANKALKLTVQQQQKVDPDSQYPQVTFFQTPVDIEIGTSGGTRVERVNIEAKPEQTFSFKVDSKPLLVNFDYKGTLIKELDFKKSPQELSYQLQHDEDVLGRLWALNQLNATMKEQTGAEKDATAAELAKVITGDKFWGMRLEAAAALSGVASQPVRDALLAGTKDANARVRARSITALATLKDSSLANVFQQSLNDQSYGVIRVSAMALGQTKTPEAYNSLVKLLDQPSWRDSIKISGLVGLQALGDKRALEPALKYTARGTYPQLRAAALRLIGNVGKDDPRVFPIASETLEQAYGSNNLTLVAAASDALANLGDPRGMAVFERVTKEPAGSPQLSAVVAQFQEKLRKVTAATPKPANTQP